MWPFCVQLMCSADGCGTKGDLYLKSYLVGLFGSLFYELKNRSKQTNCFLCRKLKTVKLKLFSLERDKNKKVFRTKTKKGQRGNFLDIIMVA